MKRLMVMTGRAGKALLEINGDRSGAAVKYGGPGELWLFDGEGNSCRGGRPPFIPVGAMAVKNGTVLLTGGFAGRKELMERAKALIPILVPLFISAFRRADELATAMECRCYHGGEGRTRLKQLKFTSEDFRCMVVIIVALVVIACTRFFVPGLA